MLCIYMHIYILHIYMLFFLSANFIKIWMLSDVANKKNSQAYTGSPVMAAMTNYCCYP